MDDATPDPPWFADGLRFTCTQCGKCCTGEPGFVWVTDDEVAAIAKFRGEPLREFVPLYTREVRGRRTLREKANGDCVFYDEGPGLHRLPGPPAGSAGRGRSGRATSRRPRRGSGPTEVCPGSGEGELIPVEEILRRVKVIKI